MDITAPARRPSAILKIDVNSNRYANKISLALAGVFIAAYFLWFTRQGLHSFFTSDDMMNLYGYWATPNLKLIKDSIVYFSPAYRPLGALFYKPIFALAGFDPFPFRLAVHGIFLVNLFLTYCVLRRLAGTREIAALGTFLGAYHLSFGALYYNTGTIYDILCFTFYFSAFLFFLRIRQGARNLTVTQLAVLSVLYIAALDTKEMAVTLPISLGIYELFYRSPKAWRARPSSEWLLGPLMPVWVTGLLTAPYVAGKMGSPALKSPGYATSFTINEYLNHLKIYLNDFCAGKFHSLWIFPAMILAAWMLRSPVLRFAVTFVLLSMLPIIFVEPRTAYVLYIPAVGASLYVAAVLVKLRELLVSLWRLPPRFVRLSPALLFVTIAALFIRVNTRSRSPSSNETVYEQPRLRSYVGQLRVRYAEFPKGTRILLVDDPDWKNQWTPVFVLGLLYRDAELHVDRLEKPSETQLAAYDLVLTSADAQIIELRRKSDH